MSCDRSHDLSYLVKMEDKTQVLLEGNFFLFPLRLTHYQVKLTKQGITFQETPQRKDNKQALQSIHFGDVVGCRCRRANSATDSAAFFTVYSYQFKGKSKRKRQRNEVSFGCDISENYEDNLKVCQKWRNVIVCLSRNINVTPDEVDQCSLPPNQRVLVLINPHSGPGKAQQIFEEHVKFMLEEADIAYKVLITEYAGHATDVIKNLRLDDWSGVVIVSGDGLIYEVINGLMSRTDWSKAIKFPIGCIPGGSGNALCCSVNYLAGEPMDADMVLHSTFVLVKHRILPIDLVLLQTHTEQMYSFLAVAWGIIADIDYESEKLRSLGSTRFTLYAIMRILKLRTYKARVSFLPISDTKLPQKDSSSKSVKFTKPRRYTIFSNTANQEALSNSVYDTGCLGQFKYLSSGEERVRSQSVPSNMSDYLKRDKSGSENLDSISESTEKLYNISESSRDEDSGHHSDVETSINGQTDNGCIDFNLNSSENEVFEESCEETVSVINNCTDPVPCPLLSPLDQPVPGTWSTLEGNFVTAMAVYLPYMGPDNLTSPDSKLNDGCINLMIIKAGISKNDLLNIFLKFSTGEHINSPHCEVVKCLAFRLEPLTDKGNIMVDGEKIKYGPIQGQILPAIARIMAIQ